MNRHELSIVRLIESDIDVLQQLSKKTFSDSFNETNSKQNMDDYLDKEFSLTKLKQQLENPQSEFHVVKMNKDQLLGYLKVNYGEAQTEHLPFAALEIERIYVDKEYQGQKIGELLINKAHQVAKSMSINHLWLGVWEHNLRAIKFYQKIGFEEFDRHVFMVGNDPQTDIMMRKQIV